MSCSKKYGPGAVYVVKESVANTREAITGAQGLPCQSITIGALSQEKIDNNAVRTDRSQNQSFTGNQAEISWELSITVPNESAVSTGIPEGLQDLFYCAGIESDGKLAENSICMRTLQIVRGDRDGELVEILNGCIVQQVVWNFSVTEMATVTFSGVASKKLELVGGRLVGGQTMNLLQDEESFTTESQMPLVRASEFLVPGTFDLNLPDGISPNVHTAGGILYGDAVRAGQTFTEIMLSEAVAADTTVSAVYYKLPAYDIYNTQQVGPSAWKVSMNNSNIPARSFALTLETGLSYGELTAGNGFPTERLSGTTKVTGSFNLYLDNEAISAVHAVDDNAINLTAGTLAINCPHCAFTETPSYELSADDAASGEFNFQATCPWAEDHSAVHF